MTPDFNEGAPASSVSLTSNGALDYHFFLMGNIDKKAASFLGAAAIALYIGTGAGCKSSDGTNPPPPTQYEHAIGVNATYFFSGSPANGTYTVKMLSNGQAYNGAIGQKISLAKTTTQSEPCSILISADGALPREYTQIGVTNSDITTNV